MRRRLKAVHRAAAWCATRCDDLAGWCLAALLRLEKEGRMTRRQRAIVAAVQGAMVGAGLGGLWLLGRGIGWW